MAFASRTYTPGSSTTDFALTNTDGNAIGYIRESDITVTVNGATFTNAASGANTYQFTGAVSLEQPSGTTIRLNAGVTGTVVLTRATGIAAATVTYTAGSTLTSSDLNNADNQIRFGLQEFNDTYDAFLTGTGDFSTLAGVIGGSETWTSSDAFMATTGAIDTRVAATIDAALVGDVSGGDGVSIVDNTPNAGQIRVDLDPDIATLRTMQTGAATALAALTATEVGILDGATLTTAELNHVDGVTSGIQAQLNNKQTQDADLDQLSGCQAGAAAALAALTQAEVQILDGATVTTAELNVLDGIPGTLTNTELGFVDGVTSAIQTQLNNKQAHNTRLDDFNNITPNDGVVVVGDGSNWVGESGSTARTSLGAQAAATDLTNLSSCQTGASAALALLTSTEVAILDGATLSTTELNFVDGVSSAIQGQLDLKQPLDNELTTLAGMTGGTASILANATGLGATLAEINSICENRTAETTISPTSDAHIPTSKAVNDRILTVTNALGGFVAIDNEVSFPNTHPDPGSGAGTVVSIADVGGLVVNSSGVATNASTVGGTAVTINGIATTFRGTTMTAGVGMQVQTTSTLNTYDYHKAILREQDISSISTDIEDFGNRYRVGSSNPTSDNDPGDLFFNTGSDKMLVRNAANNSWDEVQSVGNFFISTLSPAFDGSTIDFTVTNAPANAEQIILSINGVIQQPNAGTGRPTDGFSLNGSTIQLPTGTGPAANTPHFVIVLGSTVNIGTPSNNTVTEDILQSGCVTNAKVKTDAAIAGTKIDPDFGSQNILTTGRILLGTTTEGEGDADDLTIASAGNTGITIRSGTSNDGAIFFSDGTSGNAEFEGTIQYLHSTNAMTFKTNHAERLRIDSSGNVGIGTTPTTSLEIGASTDSENVLRINHEDNGGSAQFQLNAFGTASFSMFSNFSGGALSGIPDDAFGLTTPHSHPIVLCTAGTERMRITSDGKVGIGTTSPDFEFQVEDSSGSAVIRAKNGSDNHICDLIADGTGGLIRTVGNEPLRFDTNQVERMRLDTSGNVGVSETSPDFSGFGSNGGGIELDDVNTSFTAVKVSHGAADLYLVSAGSATFISTRTDHDIVIEKNTAEVARFTVNGLKVPSGKGIDFSSTSDAGGMTSELLDDYEEGTWEPVITPGTNSFGSITMHGDTGGSYTRVGNLVRAMGCVRWTACDFSAASGNMRISLPFTGASRDNGDNADSLSITRTTAWNGSLDPRGVQVAHGSAQLNVFGADLLNNTVTVNGEMSTNGAVQFDVTYRV